MHISQTVHGTAEKPIACLCSQNFFSHKDFVQLKGKFRFLMSKHARLPEREDVRVFDDSRLREQPISRNRTWLATRLPNPLFKCLCMLLHLCSIENAICYSY